MECSWWEGTEWLWDEGQSYHGERDGGTREREYLRRPQDHVCQLVNIITQPGVVGWTPTHTLLYQQFCG